MGSEGRGEGGWENELNYELFFFPCLIMLVRWCSARVPVLGIISEVKGSIGGRSS